MFPDYRVREYAVGILEELSDSELQQVLLQLVQALKFQVAVFNQTHCSCEKIIVCFVQLNLQNFIRPQPSIAFYQTLKPIGFEFINLCSNHSDIIADYFQHEFITVRICCYPVCPTISIVWKSLLFAYLGPP